MRKNKRGKNLKYIIIASVIVFILYIAWSIMTSGVLYFTYDIINPSLKVIERRLGIEFPNESEVLKITKANITNLYAEVNIPDKDTDRLLSIIENNDKFTPYGKGIDYGEFTGWCNYDTKDVQSVYVEENYRGKGIELHSIIIIMRPENEYRKVYIFKGDLAW